MSTAQKRRVSEAVFLLVVQLFPSICHWARLQVYYLHNDLIFYHNYAIIIYVGLFQ